MEAVGILTRNHSEILAHYQQWLQTDFVLYTGTVGLAVDLVQ